jgi:hypothetical protein
MDIILDPGRVRRAKRGFATRRASLDDMRLVLADAAPRPGDLLLARVEALGHHPRLEQPDGRRAELFPGDEILVACGNRYAPDQFEAEVGPGLEPRHLVAAGGIAALALSRNERVAAPTEIAPIGLVGDAAGRPVTLARYALTPRPDAPPVPTIVVAGTAMNAGKTTAAAALVRGLAGTGHRVGAAKLTGTGAGGDLWSLLDAGAARAVDFTDAGHASTYRVAVADLVRTAETLIGHLAAEGATAIVAEVADGLYQEETAALLRAEPFRRSVDGVVFAAGDAMGAAGGTAWLRDAGHRVIAVGGLVARSPLARREAAAATGLECLTPAQLADPQTAVRLLPMAEPVSARAAE